MSDQRTPLSRAFFLELVLVFAIFAFCAVICLQVFAGADTESRRSAAIAELGIKSQQIAESFKAEDGEIAGLEVAAAAMRDGDKFSWFFDKDLNATEEATAYFVLACELKDSDQLRVATMTLTEVAPAKGDVIGEGESPTELFSYDVSKYVRSGRTQ